eukprot:m51a1_g12 putative mitogen activated protein kinase kinase kinase 3 (288) ;mRNA; r:49326-66891
MAKGSSGPCALLGCGWGVWDNDSDPATPCVSVCTLIGVPVECFDSVYGCDWCGVSCTHKGGCGIAAKSPPTTSGLVLHWTFEGSTDSERVLGDLHFICLLCRVLDQETCLASVNCTWCSGQSQCFPGACPAAGGARSKAAVIGGAVGGGGGAAVVLVVVGGLALGRWIRKRQKLTYHDEVDASEILMGEVIGQGSFGVVYKARWRDTEVAAKVFSVQSLSAKSIAQFEKEVDVMRALRHPNILLFMCHAKNDTNLIIVTDFGLSAIKNANRTMTDRAEHMLNMMQCQ